MFPLYGILVIIFLQGYCDANSPILVNRDTKDVVDIKADTCFPDSYDISTGGPIRRCICLYPTFMSKDDGEVGCFTSSDVGCRYSLGNEENTFLVKKGYKDVSEKIKQPPEPTTSKPGPFASMRVFIWNIVKKGQLYRGTWVDVSEELEGFTSYSKNYLKIKNTKKIDWPGQLIKVQFGKEEGSCLTVKFEVNDRETARMGYPADLKSWLEKFKHIPKPYTTLKPTHTKLSTTSSETPSPEPTTSQTPAPEPTTTQTPTPETTTPQTTAAPEPTTTETTPAPEPTTIQTTPAPEPTTVQTTPAPEPTTTQTKAPQTTEFLPTSSRPTPAPFFRCDCNCNCKCLPCK